MVKMECRVMLFIFLNLTVMVNSCSQPPRWKPKSIRSRLSRAQTIIYGRDMGHTRVNSSILVNLDVHCVLKNTHNIRIPKTIVIEEVYQGQYPIACIENAKTMKKASRYIIMIQRSPYGTSYFWFMPINIEEAVFPATHKNIRRARRARGVRIPAASTTGGSNDQCYRLRKQRGPKRRRNRKKVQNSPRAGSSTVKPVLVTEQGNNGNRTVEVTQVFETT